MLNDTLVTEFPTAISTNKPITLDSVVKEMETWRRHKKTAQEPIPDVIWQHIFSLRGQFSESTLRAATGISNTQFHRKITDQSMPLAEKPMPNIDFCEVKQPTSSVPRPFYKPAKIPASNTLVVEFCRADGHLMKIHTTTDSFAELMKAFFDGV